MARGYASSRIVEALILIVGFLSLLSLLTIGEEYVQLESPQTLYLETLAAIAKKVNFWTYQIAMLILGLGSTLLCYALYKQRLIPILLSVVGLVGYALLSIGAVLEFFGYNVGILLSLPGDLFEVLFGFWLIVKGFHFTQASAIPKW